MTPFEGELRGSSVCEVCGGVWNTKPLLLKVLLSHLWD